MEASKARVRQFLGTSYVPAPVAVHVSDDVMEQMQGVWGDALPQFLPAVIGLSAEAALRLGGVKVIGEDDQPRYEWPERLGPGIGYCLFCHQHNTLVADAIGELSCSSCRHPQSNDGLWV